MSDSSTPSRGYDVNLRPSVSPDASGSLAVTGGHDASGVYSGGGGDDLQGRRYWRSLNDYAQSPELRDSLAREFPDYDPDELLGMSRRQFMKLAGASMALAGLTLTGCRRWPKEKIVPYNSRPDGQMPGVPQTYASMLQRGGVAYGLFVHSVDGRPTHVAGNPLHPIQGDRPRFESGDIQYGSADPFTTASILALYDPDRSRAVLHRHDGKVERKTWADFGKALSLKGKKIAVLSEARTGPTFEASRDSFLKQFPGTTWTTWEPLHHDTEIEGARLAFGRPLRTHYDLSRTDVLACFDSDLLTDHPAAGKHARGWVKRRKSCDQGQMSRVYAVGPALTPTLATADEHIQVKPSTVAAMLEALARAVGVEGFSASPPLEPIEQSFVEHLASDLKAARGRSVVSAGTSQPGPVHALALSINQTLGNLGQTVTFTPEPLGESLGVNAIGDLVADLDKGEVDLLLILGGNPVHNAPAELNFADALAKAKTTVHLSEYDNETSVRSTWHLPEAHYLECWGDGRAWDGTLCLQQPLILPLWDGKSPSEVLAMLAGDEATESYDLVRRAWSTALGAGDYDLASHQWAGAPVDTTAENAWRAVVRDGLLEGSAWETVSATPGRAMPTGISVSTQSGMQVTFRVSPSVYDGRYANLGWLQELPDPITKVTWDNPALVSVADALAMGLANGDVIRVTVDGRSLELPCFITAGQAPGTLVLTLGQGRTAAGRIGSNVGFDTYMLRGSGNQWLAYSAKVEKTGAHHPLATVMEHHLIDVTKLASNGTDRVAAWGIKKRVGEPGHEGTLVKQASLAEYKANPYFASDGAHGDVTLQLYDGPLAEHFRARALALIAEHPEAVAEGWTPREQFNDRHAWGMTIDLTACIGCNACVVACQSENNIPVVGKDQVMMSREMHWIRIDSYYRGDPAAITSSELDAVFMPVTCVHCENAPCEQVCPVAATVHDTEGLNTMVYNRCIGTRYCSNNCPYKVRRFNYFDYHAKLETDSFRNNRKAGGISNKPWLLMPDQQQVQVVDQVRRMVFNPEVTVRMRGVMEKCTYCTQRIAHAKIDAKAAWAKAKTAGREVADYPYVEDGAVTTACQAACPTEAITFGNVNDPKSRVAALQTKNKRSYKLLEELNSRPRTKHMGLVRNPVKA